MTLNVRITHLASSEGRAMVTLLESPKPAAGGEQSIRAEHLCALAPGESRVVAIPAGWDLSVYPERREAAAVSAAIESVLKDGPLQTASEVSQAIAVRNAEPLPPAAAATTGFPAAMSDRPSTVRKPWGRS